MLPTSPFRSRSAARPFTRRALLSAAAATAVLVTATACGGTAQSGTAAAGEGIKKLSIVVPANTGGGWDQTGRALADAVKAGSLAGSSQVENVPGAGGTNGLAKLATEKDPNTLMVMGYVMVGSVETNGSKNRLEDTTPIARLTEEPLVLVVPKDSPYQSVDDLVADIAAKGKDVAVTGGSAGGADHILMGQILKAAGIPSSQLNYIGYSGGGESLAALLGNKVQAGISGVGEYAEQVKAGTVRALAVSGSKPSPALPEVTTLTDQGIDVVLTNWRGVVAPGSIDADQKAALVELVGKVHESAEWKETLAAKNWDDAYLSGDEFDSYLAEEIEAVKATLSEIGLVK
ncbi:Bug family tripartite tricarboxylate transporter substrate binding protein [Sinomonas halotolerans]|uniref:Tripartite tricarboxylate transporter substrate-binding protein n=1 Tax=Sinomonas halotolerans TaxID=1644133 RepID=A0ABU9WW77_9MICC